MTNDERDRDLRKVLEALDDNLVDKLCYCIYPKFLFDDPCTIQPTFSEVVAEEMAIMGWTW